MGVFEKIGRSIASGAEGNLEDGWSHLGSAIDELFNSDSGKSSSRARKWIITCKKCGFKFQQKHATAEPNLDGIYRCPDCGQKGPNKKPNKWSYS